MENTDIEQRAVSGSVRKSGEVNGGQSVSDA